MTPPGPGPRTLPLEHQAARWSDGARPATIGVVGPPGDVRASDAERELVVQRLQRAVGQGRLTTEEFEERVGVAYAATTRGELTALTRDLPGHLW